MFDVTIIKIFTFFTRNFIAFLIESCFLKCQCTIILLEISHLKIDSMAYHIVFEELVFNSGGIRISGLNRFYLGVFYATSSIDRSVIYCLPML